MGSLTNFYIKGHLNQLLSKHQINNPKLIGLIAANLNKITSNISHQCSPVKPQPSLNSTVIQNTNFNKFNFEFSKSSELKLYGENENPYSTQSIMNFNKLYGYENSHVFLEKNEKPEVRTFIKQGYSQEEEETIRLSQFNKTDNKKAFYELKKWKYKKIKFDKMEFIYKDKSEYINIKPTNIGVFNNTLEYTMLVKKPKVLCENIEEKELVLSQLSIFENINNASVMWAHSVHDMSVKWKMKEDFLKRLLETVCFVDELSYNEMKLFKEKISLDVHFWENIGQLFIQEGEEVVLDAIINLKDEMTRDILFEIWANSSEEILNLLWSDQKSLIQSIYLNACDQQILLKGKGLNSTGVLLTQLFNIHEADWIDNTI